MFKTFDIIAIGDTMIDAFLELDKKEAEVHCSLHQTECKICFHYADKIPVSKFTKTVGGNATNIAVGARRLGLHSALVTMLGRDEEAKLVLRQLWHEKVDTRFVKHDKRTNFSTVINYLGERTIFVYHEPRDYHLPKLPRARFAYLTSMNKGWEGVIKPLTTYLEQTQTRLAYNPGTHQLRAGRKVSQSLLDLCDILFVNKQEAALFTDWGEQTPIEKLMAKLHQFGPRLVVITDGPNGSYASDASGQYQLGIFDVPVVERTGTGDAYALGFTAATALGHDITEAMRWGSFESAAVLQQIGPQAGLLHRPQLRKYEEKYKTFVAKPLRRKG